MTKIRSIQLSALFVAIALLVSGSLVMNLHSNYANAGRSPSVSAALHLLQDA